MSLHTPRISITAEETAILRFMDRWRPLFSRGKADPRFDEPVEGLPPFLMGPVLDWIGERFGNLESSDRRIVLDDLELSFHLPSPLDRTNPRAQLNDLLSRCNADEHFTLEVIEYVLNHIDVFRYQNPYHNNADVGSLSRILQRGGSTWEVVASDDGRARLSRRAIGPIRDTILSLPPDSRAHAHLVAAWTKLSGRNPDDPGAYQEAVRAVEAAARPAVSPKDGRARLGKMAQALRDKPEKWETTMLSVEQIAEMMEVVNRSQVDRHGTDDDSVPISVTSEQADVAFTLCLALCRLFAGGHVGRR